MRVYTYSEARQKLASVLDEAREKGEIRIKRRDGSEFEVYQTSLTDKAPDPMH